MDEIIQKAIDIITILDYVTILSSFLTLIFVIVNFYYMRRVKKKENTMIRIVIQKDGISKELPIKILRKQVSRSEILGILGVFDRESNFVIAYTSSKEFFEQITQIQKNKLDVLTIPLKKNDKFDCSL